MDIVVQIIINSLIAASFYALIAIGFNMVYSISKFFDLAFGTIAVLGAYFVLLLNNVASQIPLGITFILGVLFGGLMYFLIQNIFYRHFENRKSSNIVMLVVSLGVMTVVQAFVAMTFTSRFQTINVDLGSNFKFFGAVITPVQVLMIAASIIVFIAIYSLYKFTDFGKKARALADDKFVSQIVGINTNKIKSSVFFIAGSVASTAGILSFMDVGIEPTSGFVFLLNGVVAFIIGGPGNFLGSVVGALIIGFTENIGVWFISGQWKEAIVFFILILFLLFRPGGIFKPK